MDEVISQSVQLLSRVWLFAIPLTAVCQASLFITNSWSLLKLNLHWVCDAIQPSQPLSSPSHAFNLSPASGSFPVSQFFRSDNKTIGVSASASVLPMNIQDWFPWGWIGWISLLFKGLLRVFSNNTVQKHHIFSAQLSL